MSTPANTDFCALGSEISGGGRSKTPSLPRAHLGKLRAHLDQGRHEYEMVISDRTGAPADIDAVVAMISLLWHGQRDRREGGPTSAPVTQEAAETAVHTAAILVHWTSSGSIRKK
jgi:hypothetical protein